MLLAIIVSLSKTDIAKIKNLPEIPGVPVFGSLLDLGSTHAKRFAEWSQKYGPVFQVRLGTKVHDYGFKIAVYLA